METGQLGRSGKDDELEGLRAKLAGKYLTFNLDQELFGVEILKVQEIIGVLPVTKVPRSPHYIKGVINLRGKVIPVIDLRLKLDIPPQDYDDKTCIIVVNIAFEGKDVAVGVVVDSVREVFYFAPDHIELAPKFGVDADSTALIGIGKLNEAVVMLLDISKALADDSGFLSEAGVDR